MERRWRLEGVGQIALVFVALVGLLVAGPSLAPGCSR